MQELEFLNCNAGESGSDYLLKIAKSCILFAKPEEASPLPQLAPTINQKKTENILPEFGPTRGKKVAVMDSRSFEEGGGAVYSKGSPVASKAAYRPRPLIICFNCVFYSLSKRDFFYFSGELLPFFLV
ncbi:hypothetical protein JTE90_012153 [Oedothorax gibbosus]|uniref:Uncharacterized protein n=1 Tax=Oedothorax gibbosus TaxID=931172 RepID=A0AAV6ULK8_9ARAC|nr:hypothetical protein JTE90_012153 [Oedothorax gibbosus]